jgi:hypothetical protein
LLREAFISHSLKWGIGDEPNPWKNRNLKVRSLSPDSILLCRKRKALRQRPRAFAKC